MLGVVLSFPALPVSSAWAATIEWSGDGDGSSWSDGGNWTGFVVPGPSDTAVVRQRSGGPSNVVVPAGVVVDALVLELGGRLNGGSIRVDGSFAMSGGNLGTALELSATATGHISTANLDFPPSVSGPIGSIRNRGSLTMAQSALLRMLFDASIDNSGTLRLENGSVVNSSRCCTLPTSSVRNAGTLVTGAGTATLEGMALVNSGVLRHEAGTLLLTIAPSSLAGGSRLRGTGRVVVRGRAVQSVTASLVVDPGMTLELQDGQVVGAAATIAGGGTFAWTAGQIGGQLTVASDSRLLIDGTAEKRLAGVGGQLTNGGTAIIRGTGPIRLLGSSIFTNAGQLTQTGPTTWTFSNCCTAPAIWQNTGSYQLTIPAAGTALIEGIAVRNSGSVLLTSGRLATRLLGYVQTAGSTRLAGGTLAVPQGLIDIQGGTLAGFGGIVGAVRNAAVVDPRGLAAATTPGTLAVQGSYTQTATATLRLRLAGTAPGSFDRVTVTGAAKLAGTLSAALAAGFSPAHGTFLVLKGGSRTGTFATVQLPAPTWRVSYTATGVSVGKP